MAWAGDCGACGSSNVTSSSGGSGLFSGLASFKWGNNARYETVYDVRGQEWASRVMYQDF